MAQANGKGKDMAHIKKITFNRVGEKEGCACDRCGQYIRNIWTVQYDTGVMNYGIDCFEKVQKSGLNATGKKAMNKVLKSIQAYTDRLLEYTSGELTEETDEGWKLAQADWNKDDYWHGRDYNEYRDWMVNEFFPYRLSCCDRELKRFQKINFEA